MKVGMCVRAAPVSSQGENVNKIEWAAVIGSLAAVIVGLVAAVYVMLGVTAKHHLGLATATLTIAAVCAAIMVLVLIVLASVLRYIDRRQR